jgi:hypothetical protein
VSERDRERQRETERDRERQRDREGECTHTHTHTHTHTRTHIYTYIHIYIYDCSIGGALLRGPPKDVEVGSSDAGGLNPYKRNPSGVASVHVLLGQVVDDG